MSSTLSRPDDATLGKYLTGELSEAEALDVERYLERGPELPSSFAPADDTLLSAIRGQQDTPADPTRVQKVMDWLAKMGLGSNPDASGGAAELAEEDPAAEVLGLLGPPAQPGEMGTLGGYRVVRLLGRGGMGVVLEAIDPKLNRRIALKAMRPALANNPTAKQRFLREAKLAASVEHDHIVPIFQVDEDRGVLFLAMPFLKGEPLDAKLKREGRLSPLEIARFGRQAAEGLSAAHETGLIHRDIKPANLWLESLAASGGPGATARVKVLDFGLARTTSSDINLTTSGVVMGTPAYMAPEQANGKPLDARADLFSLGVVLYRAATGEMPFKGDTPIAIIHSLALDTPVHPCSLHPELPKRLGDLIENLLSKEPAKRPASAREVAKLLGQIEHKLSHDTVPIALPVKPIVQPLDPWADIDEDMPAPPNSPTPATLLEKTPPRPRNKLLIAAGLLGLAAAIAAVVIVIIKDKDGKEIARVPVPEGGSVEVKDGTLPKVPDSTADAAMNRAAAEWLVTVSKEFGVSHTRKGYLNIQKGEKLPEGNFKIVAIDLSNPAIKGDDLYRLRGLGVTTLVLTGNPLGDAGLGKLPDLPALEKIYLNDCDLTDKGLRDLTRFPKLSALHVGGNRISEKGLETLAAWPGLVELRIGHTAATDATLDTLARLKKLKMLALARSKTSDRGAPRFRELPALESLDLSESQLTDVGLAALHDCRALKSLLVYKTKVSKDGVGRFAAALPACRIEWDGGVIEPKVSPDGNRKAAEWVLKVGGSVMVYPRGKPGEFKEVRQLTDLPTGSITLERVHFFSPAVKPFATAELDVLRGLPDLKWLDFRFVKLGDEGLDRIADLPGLEVLWLEGVGLTDASVARLKRFGGLNQLTLGFDAISDATLSKLAAVPNLKSLRITGNLKLTDDALANLAGLKLEKLEIVANMSAITDAGLKHLYVQSKLQHLLLRNCKVLEGGIKKLAAALPGCRIEWDGGVIEPKQSPESERKAAEWVLKNGGKLQISHDTLGFLTVEANDTLPEGEFGIVTIDLAKRPININDVGTLRGLKRLTTLVLSGVPLGDTGAARLRALPELQKLYLGDAMLTDAGLRELASLERLTVLHLGGNNLTDKAIADLLAWPALEELRLELPAITDHAVGSLVRLKDLKRVWLIGTQITDKGLEELSRLPGLQTLDVSGTKITDAGLGHLSNCRRMTLLVVRDTKVSEGQVKKLAAALPACRIEWDGGVIEPTKK